MSSDITKCKYGEEPGDYILDLDEYLDPCFAFLLKIKGVEDKLDWVKMYKCEVIPPSLYKYVVEQGWLKLEKLDEIDEELFCEIIDIIDFNKKFIYEKIVDLDLIPLEKANIDLLVNAYIERDEVMNIDIFEIFVESYLKDDKKMLDYTLRLLKYNNWLYKMLDYIKILRNYKKYRMVIDFVEEREWTYEYFYRMRDVVSFINYNFYYRYIKDKFVSWFNDNKIDIKELLGLFCYLEEDDIHRLINMLSIKSIIKHPIRYSLIKEYSRDKNRKKC
jgi:hypothetical protein